MKVEFYKPTQPVTGPAYSAWFKLLATTITAVLAGYAVNVGLRYPLMQYGLGVKLLLIAAAVMLAISYYWFLRSTITIDDKGIRQTWMYDRHVDWSDVRSVKMIGVPYMSWIFPPRLVVRTGTAFATFNGGSRPVLIEFANIALAYQLRK